MDGLHGMVEGGFILSRDSGGFRFTFEGALPKVLE